MGHKVTSRDRFREFLDNLVEDFESEITTISLVRYHGLVGDDDPGLSWAIKRVLEDYMPYEDYRQWLTEKDG